MAKIDIRGTIVPNDEAWIYDLYEIENTCPKKITDALAEALDNDEDVEIYINSGGGDVFSGSEIYSAIRSHQGNVKIHVTGLAASAASVIAMAARSDMSPTAQMMIHNVSCIAGGDYHDMDHMSETLQTANKAIAAAYITKSGMSEKDALKLMDRETWLTASEAVEMGLIDEITEPANETAKLVASVNCNVLPAKLINEHRTRKEKIQAKLNELKNYEV